jgi:hypothetical protein
VSVVGAYVPNFSENFDGVTPPARLLAGATNAINPDSIFWQSSNTGLPAPPDSQPNAAGE